MKKAKMKPGQKADNLKLEGSWEEAVRLAIQKPRPPQGWPKPETKTRKRKAR